KLITGNGLTIRAANITVDQGGTIQVNPYGTGPQGNGPDGSQYYYGGSGGSYGTVGTAGYSNSGSPAAFGSSTDSLAQPGGRGGIKLLYGSQLTTAGSINPTPNVPPAAPSGPGTAGLLPPLTLTSTTHPDPSLVYNDDFNSVAITWNQPYQNKLGYYVLFN